MRGKGRSGSVVEGRTPKRLQPVQTLIFQADDKHGRNHLGPRFSLGEWL